MNLKKSTGMKRRTFFRMLLMRVSPRIVICLLLNQTHLTSQFSLLSGYASISSTYKLYTSYLMEPLHARFASLKPFFAVLGRSCVMRAEIAKRLPSSLYKTKVAFAPKPQIRRYVVCRQCHRLYYMKDCVVGLGVTS